MTTLPIDASRRPWKPKYLTSETTVLNYWFKFGIHSNGNVDISDGEQEIFVDVPVEMAEEIIKARRDFCDVIEKNLCNFEVKP